MAGATRVQPPCKLYDANCIFSCREVVLCHTGNIPVAKLCSTLLVDPLEPGVRHQHFRHFNPLFSLVIFQQRSYNTWQGQRAAV